MLLPEPNDDRFSAIDPLDSRYYDKEIARYLSERSRIAYQAHVEAALAHTLADFGICSQRIASQIESACRLVSVEAVYREELETKHDIKALVNCIKQILPVQAQPYVHFGATSYDIISTATSLQLQAAVNDLIAPRLAALLDTLLTLAETHAGTIQIGRTHGQHAVPITFGFAVAGYVNRLGENLLAVQGLASGLRGKFSGAVGAYNALSVFVDDPQAFEKKLLGHLGILPSPISTQIVPAEQVVRLVDELAISAGIMANISHDMRHLQRSEIAEVQERFEKGQTGSSTMAHKRNPWNFENVISLSKQVTAQLINANLNISSEHQRDLTDSASSRFYGLTFACVAAMAQRLNSVMSKLEVNETNMQRNLHLTKGAIAAEPLYLLLEKYGHTQAHEEVKSLAHRALTKQLPLHELAASDKTLAPYWRQFSSTERLLIKEPEAHYIGQATKKTQAIATFWRKKLR